MPIFAKNKSVGAKAPPVPVEENKHPKTFELVKLEAKKKLIIQKTSPSVKKEEPSKKEELLEKIENKYIYKEDGVLVRHINTKSHYMRDVLDLDSEN